MALRIAYYRDYLPSRLDEAGQLLAIVSGLASGCPAALIHELPFVEVIGDYRLAFTTTGSDQGITRGAPFAEFTCGFTMSTWDNVAGLIEPFAEGGGGFQWLSDGTSDASLLLSVSGQW
jgi:hypothetical protein